MAGGLPGEVWDSNAPVLVPLRSAFRSDGGKGGPGVHPAQVQRGGLPDAGRTAAYGRADSAAREGHLDQIRKEETAHFIRLNS